MKILRMSDLRDLYGLPRSTVNNWRRTGIFPEPLRLGQNSIAWRQGTIEAWLNSREQNNNTLKDNYND